MQGDLYYLMEGPEGRQAVSAFDEFPDVNCADFWNALTQLPYMNELVAEEDLSGLYICNEWAEDGIKELPQDQPPTRISSPFWDAGENCRAPAAVASAARRLAELVRQEDPRVGGFLEEYERDWARASHRPTATAREALLGELEDLAKHAEMAQEAGCLLMSALIFP